jgi:Right handed beta helix region/Secretion system C-terminal sorting domain
MYTVVRRVSPAAILAVRFVFSLLVVNLIPALDAQAQQCYLQQDCGPGSLCGAGGTCQPVRDVLTAGGGVIRYVDAAKGNNSNPGTEAAPWATIKHAAQQTSINPGDAILVRAGTYYGEIIPAKGGVSGKRIAYVAYPGEEVIVSGATRLTETWTSDGGSVWKMNWPHPKMWVRNVNTGDHADDARRRDVLIADGVFLQAVYTRADVREGTFFLQGSPDNPTVMYAWLPGGKNPNSVRMDTSLLNHLFNPSTNDVNCRFGETRGYFHLIGFTFRHTANEGYMGAVCSGDEGSLIENVTAEWTNGAGFFISGKNHIVRGVRAFYNGMSGIRGEYCDNCTLEYSTSKYNNAKGYRPFWESGGGKWLFSTNSTFRYLDFSDNEGPGLWLDMDNFDNVVEYSRFDRNYGVNIFLEWTSDRNIVRNNVSTRARFAEPSFFGYGLLIHAANDNIVLHNTFMANEGGGLRIRTDSRDKATGNQYYNNLFVANTRLHYGEHKSNELSIEQHANLTDARTNKGDGNVFWYRNYSIADYNTFQLRPNSGEVTKSSNLGPWQNAIKGDYNSMVMDLSKPHVRDTSDHVAGWHLADGAQFIGKAVPLPAGIPAVRTDYYGNSRPTTGATPGALQPGSIGNGNNGAGGSGGGGNNGGAVSVQLLSLDIVREEEVVGIFWEARNEDDLVSYVIERSTDGDAFESIGVVERSGTSTASSEYIWTDRSTPAGSNRLFYRLRSVYVDDSESLSHVVEVSIDGPGQFQLKQSYPNPTAGVARIGYSLSEAANVSIRLFDLLGREVAVLAKGLEAAGEHEVTFDTSSIPAGLYIYRLEAGESTQSRKLTVIR